MHTPTRKRVCEKSMPPRGGNSEKSCLIAEKVMEEGFSVARGILGDEYGILLLPAHVARMPYACGIDTDFESCKAATSLPAVHIYTEQK